MNSVFRAIMTEGNEDQQLPILDLMAEPRYHCMLTVAEQGYVKYLRACYQAAQTLPSMEMFTAKFKDYDFDLVNSVDLSGRDIRIHLLRTLEERRKLTVSIDVGTIANRIASEGFTDKVFNELRDKYREMQAASGCGGLRSELISYKESLEPLPPREMIVKGLVDKGSVTVVFGDPGSQKTTISYHLALCIAGGVEFMGKAAKQGQKALILDEEMGDYWVRNSIQRLKEGNNHRDDLSLDHLPMCGINLLTPSGMQEIEDLIIDEGYNFCIIDSLFAISPGESKNDEQVCTWIIGGLRHIAERTGCAFWLIHHSNRQGSFQGNQSIKGNSDNFGEVRSKRLSESEYEVSLTWEKTRHGKGSPLACLVNYEGDEDTGPIVLQAVDFSSTSTTSDTPTFKPAPATITANSFVWSFILDRAKKEDRRFSVSDMLASPYVDARWDQATLKKHVRTYKDLGHVSEVIKGARGQEAVWEARTEEEASEWREQQHQAIMLDTFTSSDAVEGLIALDLSATHPNQDN